MKRVKAKGVDLGPVSIWFDEELGEYQVRLKGRPGATYYTDDRADAFATAQAMRNGAAGGEK